MHLPQSEYNSIYSTTTSLAMIKSQYGPRVLLSSHSTRIDSLFQQAFHNAGLVMQSHTPDEIFHVLHHHLFDVVVLEINSSTTEAGLLLLQQIRQQCFEVPVVVVVEDTLSNERDVIQGVSEIVKIGIQGLLFKPTCPSEIHQTIVEVIEKHQREMLRRQNVIQQIVQTEKLATAGRIVSSISHEMNNPLQALHNALHLLGKRSFNGRKRQQYLAMAREEVENLITIVHRMLNFYRPSLDGMRPTNVNILLESTLQRLDTILNQGNVQVLRDWYPRLPDVFAIGSRLKQACLDLITNAVQSMPNGGTLTIRTYATDGTEYQINAGFEFRPTGSAGHQVSGPSVVIEISDTGMGISPESLQKVFEPFYTTRFNATGLGLAISYSIVEQHKGELSVSSTEGSGTTVRMRLPAIT